MKLMIPSFILILFSNLPMMIILILSLIISLSFMNLSYISSSTNPLFFQDNISMILTILSIMSSILIILSSNNQIQFCLLISLILIFLMMIFLSSNLILFFISFEMVLIPTLILITKLGKQPERIQAGIYLLIYTIFGSLPLLISILSLNPMNNFLSSSNMFYMFPIPIMMFMAFLIKLPMFFFHLWLPKAHVEAPMEGSMILAAILLKIGGYGIIRFIPFTLKKINLINNWMISISLIGAILTSINCTRQKDIKSLIAYSSVAHMGLVLASLLTMNNLGLMGAIIMMLGHGLTSSALFFMVNYIYLKHHTRNILSFKGMINSSPNLMFWWFIFISANISAPPSINFFSEIFISMSLISWINISSILIFLISFSTASFSIIIFSNTFHNSPNIYLLNPYTQKIFLSSILHLYPLIIMSLHMSLMSF